MIAMFLVGGGIISHGVPLFHHWTETLDQLAFAGVGAVASGLIGLGCGAVAVGVVNLLKKIRKN
jgi:predicted DNA repair protein MutK